MTKPFDRVALIGIGLIGSSLAHALRKHKLAGEITGYARSEATRAKALEISLVDIVFPSAAETMRNADLVILGTSSKTGVSGLLPGSTVERLLPELQCSVLALKPEGFRTMLPPDFWTMQRT